MHILEKGDRKMKNGTKIALSGVIALSSLSLCVNQAQATQLTNVNSSHTISQKHTLSTITTIWIKILI